jgi:hypothetical protein
LPREEVDLATLAFPLSPTGSYVVGRPMDMGDFDSRSFEEARLVEHGVVEAIEIREVDEARRVVTRVNVFRFNTPGEAHRYHVEATTTICRENGHVAEPVDLTGAYAMSQGGMNSLYVAFVRGDVRVAVDEAASPVGSGARDRVLAAAKELANQLTPHDGTG